MSNRPLALAAAVAMVVVAVQVRGRIDRGEGDRPHLVCATELAAVCEGLDGDAVRTTVEPAAVTATRLTAADRTDVDGWLAISPWPQLVDVARRRDGKDPLLRVGDPLARQRVGVAVWPDRLDALRKACGGDVGWACLVQAASTSSWAAMGGEAGWGVFKLGFPDPRRDAVGLLALGSMAASLAPGGPGADDELPGAVAIVARSVPRPLPSFATVRAGGPSLADAYVTAVPPATARRLTLVYPAPVVTADVVLARGAGRDGERVATSVRRARLAGDDAPGAALDLGILEALRSLWDEVAP